MKPEDKLNYFFSEIEKIQGVTYVSVIQFDHFKIKNKKTNNYNGWAEFFYGNNLDAECILFDLSRRIFAMEVENHEFLLWEKSTSKFDLIQEKRRRNNMFHGISLLAKDKESCEWVISVCCDNKTNRDIFHNDFFSIVKNISGFLKNEKTF